MMINSDINNIVWDSPYLGFCIINTNGIIISTNQTFSNWAQCLFNETDAISFNTFLNIDDAKSLNKHLNAKAIDKEINKCIVTCNFSNFNRVKLQVVSIQNYQDTTSWIIGFIKYTETKVPIESGLAMAEQILDFAQEGIIVLSPHLEVIYWNKFIEKFTEIPSSAIIGKNLLDVFPNLRNSKIEEHVALLLRLEKVDPFEYLFEIPHLNKKGWSICVFSAMYNDKGDINQILITTTDISESKKLIELQSESEEKYRTIFHTSPDAIVISQLDGIILDVNDGFCKQMKYTRNEVVGHSSLKLNFWGDANNRTYLLTKLLSQGFVDNFEFDFITKDNEVHKCLLSAKIIMLNNQNCIITITRDITERYNFENELKTKRKENSDLLNMYKLISDNISDVIWILDPEKMEFTYMSSSVYKLRGFMPEEVTQTHLNQIFSEKSAVQIIEQIPERIKDFLEKGQEFSRSFFEFEISHKNGTLMWVEIATQITRNQDGKIEVIGVTRNIDERKKTEALIKESELRYRTAFMTSPDGINIVSMDGIFVDVNEGFIQNMGYSKEEIIGKSSHDISLWVNELDRYKLVEKLQKNGYVSNLETVFRHKSGRNMTVLMSAKILMINNKPHILSISRDISDRKAIENELIKAKEKAEESDRLKSAFLANMSHEIRTPMNAIKGFAELLNLPDLLEEKRQKFIDVINQRTDDLLMLINDLLDISKIEAGQMVITDSKGDISEMFNELLSLFTSHPTLITNKDITLKSKIELKINEQLVYFDFFRLKQILINLINNALKFTKKGEVLLGCKLYNASTLLFWVEDTGIGIPKDKLEIIFERFRQASDENTAKLYGGTGLGLSIVKGLAELMKGKVWCTSTLDVGSCFYLTIPFQPCTTIFNESDLHDSKSVFYDWNDKVILIVEDDLYNGELIQEFIAPTFATCIIAENGMSALEQFQKNTKIDLVLMDIQLPDISGYDVTRKIRYQNKEIPILAQTAYAANSDRIAALNAGCTDYISKPLNKKMLLLLMEKYLK